MRTVAPLIVRSLIACAFTGAVSAAGTRAELDGVWLLYGSQVPKDPGLTPAGREKLEHYDPLRDDGDLKCKPVSFTRIMHTPSPPIEIRQRGDRVEINYEFMDVHRRVPLGGKLAGAPYTVADHPHMGRSVGRYEGEELVVDTVDVEAGYLDTLGFPGLRQSRKAERVEVAGFHVDGVDDELLALVAPHRATHVR